MNKIIVFILVFKILFSCKQRNSAIALEKIEKKDTQQELTVHSEPAQHDTLIHEQSIKVDSNELSLSLLTQYYNQIIDSPAAVLNQPISKQELTFTGPHFSLRIPFKTETIVAYLENRLTLRVQERNVYEISVITGKRGWFYKISAASNFMPQSEDYSAFSSRGVLLWNSNSVTKKMAMELRNDPKYFNLVKMLEYYGVEFNDFNRPEITAETNIVIR